jgi:hypothetical protein
MVMTTVRDDDGAVVYAIRAPIHGSTPTPS